MPSLPAGYESSSTTKRLELWYLLCSISRRWVSRSGNLSSGWSLSDGPHYKHSAESLMPVHDQETGELVKDLPAPWSFRSRGKKWLQIVSKDIDDKIRRSFIWFHGITNGTYSEAGVRSISKPARVLSLPLPLLKMVQRKPETYWSVQKDLTHPLENFSFFHPLSPASQLRHSVEKPP